MARKLVHGVATNDAGYPTQRTGYVDGKRKLLWVCPYYRTWRNMLNRCYNPTYQLGRPSYRKVSVCNDWLLFSNFREWMVQQSWEGKVLDKDILSGPGSSTYSPETCLFISSKLNNFILAREADRGDLPIGVCRNKHGGHYAQANNPETQKNVPEHLGTFPTIQEASDAWYRSKMRGLEYLVQQGHVPSEEVRLKIIEKLDHSRFDSTEINLEEL